MAPKKEESLTTHDVDTEAGSVSAAPEMGNAMDAVSPSKPSSPSASKPFPRLVQRNLPFYQSKNKVSVIHNKGVHIMPLLRHDWFHVFLRLPSKYSLLMLLSSWTGAVFLFAGLYMAYDIINDQDECRLGVTPEEPLAFGAAFAFSVETCTTVGYGLPSGTNAFFESCQGLQFLIYSQMVWSMLFNAFLFAFLYNRLGRSESRGAQVVSSNKAIVSVVDGQVRLQCRIYDVDSKHPIVEAHARLYVVMRERPVPRPLRLLQPDDDLGATLFISFPTVVSHHMDLYSMLHPPREDGGVGLSPGGLILRQVDSSTANRDDVVCPVCSESYGTHERWVRHVRYQQMVELHDGYPVDRSHLALGSHDLRKPEIPTMKEFKDYFREHVAELILVVEGIDPLLSGTFQALHSYRYEDIVWNASANFAPCVQVSGDQVQVDLDRFHQVDTDNHEEERNKSKASPARQPRRRRVKQVSHRRHDSFFE